MSMTTPKESDRGRVELRDAAVVVPVHRDRDGALRLVMIRRTDVGIHGGQIGFPGGNREPGDPTPLDTALREADEEIGLTRDRIEVLEALPVVETVSTRYRIAPFLARITPPPAWRPDPREVAEVLELSAADLLAPDAHAEAFEQMRGWSAPRRFPYYKVGPHRLWGASYRIVHPLLPRLAAGEWEPLR